MAKNDMEVIIYKILEYIYACMKIDRNPDLSEYGWSSKIMDIPKGYWRRIIEMLVSDGFVKGFETRYTKDGIQIKTEPPIGITMKGRDFLRDNSTMQKVRDTYGKTVEVVLSGIFGTII